MKARGSRFLIILGGGLAALAFVVVYLVMSRTSAPPPPAANVPVQEPMRTVAVAAADLPPYTVLDQTNVATLDVVASTVPSNTTSSPEDLYGKVTLVPYSHQQPIQLTQISQSGFSNVLAKGQKGYVLPVQEEDTFGGSITENDSVDLLWTATFKVRYPVRDADNKVTYQDGVYTTTKTLLQDLKVLKVVNLRTVAPTGQNGQNGAAAEQAATTAPNPGGSNSAAMYTSDAPYAEALVLAVTDQQVEVIKFAHENGAINLALRSSNQGGDHDVEKTTGVTIDTLIKSYGLVAPPAQWSPQTAP